MLNSNQQIMQEEWQQDPHFFKLIILQKDNYLYYDFLISNYYNLRTVTKAVMN